MKIAVIYIYPTANHGDEHFHRAARFIRTYRENPPLIDHAMIVVSNGGPPNGKAVAQFSWITDTRFLQHDDSGMDIGGFQMAARSIACDLMVFFGGTSYFRRSGWLRRMVDVYNAYGDGLYGCTGNQGDPKARVWPHVRTTGFWCSPKLVNSHPFQVTRNDQRYPFEHGPNCLTSWALLNNKPVYIVGWDCVKPLHDCDSMPNGFNKGKQENILAGDRLTCAPYYAHA